jgi:Fe-S-cluster-containing hydrogenase component 2
MRERSVRQIVQIHRAAPAKPATGEACNGCGVCCAAEPCPVGIILFRRRRGPCPALEWLGGEARYRCRLLTAPAAQLRWLPARLEVPTRRLFARWIAAGSGCDSNAEVG